MAASEAGLTGLAELVRAEAVSYRYPQNGHGLVPVSLVMRPGERLLVAGPSGCGKSTLARCLTGLIPHLYHGTMQGDVWLDGLRTADTPLWQLSERAGLVFQNPAAQMLGQSVEEEILFGLENLGLPRSTMQERLEAALTQFGLEAMRDRSPQTLSGGEQQKLALGAMIARRPPVLVLDEPLSMLDGAAAADLVAYLGDLAAAGMAIVVCEHREEFLRPIPDDLTQLQEVSFVEPVESKEQKGWLLRDVILLHVSEKQLKQDSLITISSSSRDKSAQVTWAEANAPDNMVMFDLSNRGTLKLVSKTLPRLATRDQWVQDADKIEITGP